MPNRLPPFILETRHGVSSHLDVDWTICPANWVIEQSRRKARNELIKEKLQSGKPVCYRSTGNSLWPLVHSNDQTTYEPVGDDPDQVQVEDIVFCQVQRGDRFFAHLVKEKWLHNGQWYFTIANYQGHENGWCRMEHIYGRLVECVH
jgi:hypothetical protein